MAISKAVEMDCRLLVMDEECLNPCIIKRSFLTDHIILMDSYKTRSAEATRRESHRTYIMPGTRYPVSKNIVYEKGSKEVSVTFQDVRVVGIEKHKLNVPVAGLFDTAQTRAVMDAVVVAKDLMNGSRIMAEVCREAVEAVMAYDPENGGSMYRVCPRPIDLAAVLTDTPKCSA